jgi:glycolate oxidase iron-sulfur subunit
MKKDPQSDFIETVNREYLKCAACGECRVVCPVYGVSGLEKNVARGRLSLAKALADGELEPSDNIAGSFENCLLCMACSSQCAGHVDMVEVVLKGRAWLAHLKGLHRIKELAFKALGSDRKYQDAGFATARLAQYLFTSPLPENSGLRLRLSLPGFAPLMERILPALPRKPFIGRADQVFKAEKQRRHILLFVGCAANYIYTEIAQETVHLLNRLGVGVTVLSKQGCCGAPVQSHGDIKTLRKLAENNIKVFSGTSDLTIITICSSGGMMLKTGYPHILAGTELEAKALDISLRTMDISEYLVERIGIEEIKHRMKRKITRALSYHDPCHLGRGQQITNQPRVLLREVCEHYEEMPDAGGCCGLGGTYGIGHAEVSEQILDKKILNIASMESVPERLATACPACIMQLTHGFYKKGFHTEVNHIVHYIWQSLE